MASRYTSSLSAEAKPFTFALRQAPAPVPVPASALRTASKNNAGPASAQTVSKYTPPFKKNTSKSNPLSFTFTSPVSASSSASSSASVSSSASSSTPARQKLGTVNTKKVYIPQSTDKITTESVNYAKPINIINMNPIIIPIGFDCGPSTFLRGSLDRFKIDTNITQYNICDLPFDTVILNESKPIIEYFKDKLNSMTAEDLQTLPNDTIFFDDYLSFKKPMISFKHDGNYINYETFKSDMIIRIKNLLTIMKMPNDLNCKIFFRKSHSKCHHAPDLYNFAANSTDLSDAITLSKYLKDNHIENFKIVLFICCEHCYDTHEFDVNFNGELLFTDHNILCVKTIDNNIDGKFEIIKTKPRIFNNIAQQLFKKAFQINTNTTYDAFVNAIIPDGNGKPKPTNGSEKAGIGCNDKFANHRYGHGYGHGRGKFSSSHGGNLNKLLLNGSSKKKMRTKKIKKMCKNKTKTKTKSK